VGNRGLGLLVRADNRTYLCFSAEAAARSGRAVPGGTLLPVQGPEAPSRAPATELSQAVHSELPMKSIRPAPCWPNLP